MKIMKIFSDLFEPELFADALLFAHGWHNLEA
jgi:hypothetical protein